MRRRRLAAGNVGAAAGGGAEQANCQAQEQALAAEIDVGVRLALLGNLWDARASYPRAQRLVELAAAADRAPEVRAAAASMLRQARVEP